MKLSTKVKISFGLLILMPVLLFAITMIALTAFQIKEINSQYNTSGTSYETLTNPVDLIQSICQSQYEELKDAADRDPELFSEEAFLTDMNNALGKRSAFLIVVQNGVNTYSGSALSSQILKELENIDPTESGENSIYLGGEYQVLVENVQFTTETGVEGTAYIVMEIQELIPQMRMLIFDGIIAVVLILILTSALFTTWIFRETVRPIKKLKLATYNIKNGNLDFELNVKGRDEVSELCRDFDEMRRRLKENADGKVRADAENKELISNISHDLKTPITAIKGYVEGIMDGVADTDEKMDRYIRTIYNKACDMDKLIDELTFYSKIDTNRIPYHYSRINLTDYFDDCVEELTIELEAKGIRLVYDNRLSADTKIVADAEQFKRVINNITGNSVKYMEKEQGEIGIALWEDDFWVYIDIKDNGKGISREDLPYIFDRFYRTDASRNSRQGGSGIGLSIVKKIISDHGGSISAESDLGKGTTMHIMMSRYREVIKDEQNSDSGR